MRKFILGLLLLTSAAAMGDGKLSAAEEKALADTQAVLKNRQAREKKLAQDPNARKANEILQKLAGSPERAEEMYGLAADLMGNLVKDTGGDPEKMEKILEKAQSDPQGFAETFTPEQQKKLEEIAKKIERKYGSVPKP